jgi:hypothetical protein
MKRRRLLLTGLLAATALVGVVPAAWSADTPNPTVCLGVHVIVGSSPIIDTRPCLPSPLPGTPSPAIPPLVIPSELTIPQLNVPPFITPNDPPGTIPPLTLPIPPLPPICC